MNCILSIVFLACSTLLIVESQPIAFDQSGLALYFERINPRFRNHRNRLRPFVNTLSSPITNVRGARSTMEKKAPSDLEPKAECFYSFESFQCVGITGPNSEPTTVQCDVSENFSNTDLASTKKFALSDLRVIKHENNSSNETNSVVKLYLFGQKDNETWFDYRLVNSDSKSINMFSIHGPEEAGASSDKGLSILDKDCWTNLVHFFFSIRVGDEIKVHKTPFVLPVKSIANLQIV